MAKDMVSLKRSPKEQKGDILGPSDRDVFPVDVFIHDDEVSKLGLSGAQVGEEMTLIANVKVTSVSSDERSGGKKSQNVRLSLREASVGPKVKKGKSHAEALFGDE